jgi:hypothetical protein
MPCRDDRTVHDPAPSLKKRLDKVTRLLCELCVKLEDAERFDALASKKLKAWWDKHKLADRRRRRAEQMERDKDKLRGRALAKARAALTDEEREALGIE